MNAPAKTGAFRTAWRRSPGLIVVVPLVAVLWGTYWTLPVRQRPTRISVVAGEGAYQTVRDFAFTRAPDGSPADPASLLPQGAVLGLEFDRPMQDFAMAVQMRGKDKAVLRGSKEPNRSQILWEVSRLKAAGSRLATRTTDLALAAPVRQLRLQSHWSTDGCAVADVRVHRLVPLSHLWLLPACWLPFGLAGWWMRRAATRPRAERLLRFLDRGDTLISAALVFAVFFQLTRATLLVLAGLLLLLALLRLFRRSTGKIPAAALAFNVVFLFLFFRFAPGIVERFIVYRTASDYHLDVDHRMKADGKDVNEDGIRFRGVAADVREDDFNVLFLGDSFTYGMKLPYDDTVPRVFERLAAERGVRPAVRTVNFGWVSSSPLLSYRLLMDLGAKYKPDLAVLLLDPTDYHDDIKYAAKIAEKEGMKFDSGLLLDNLVDRMLLKHMSIHTLWRLKHSFRPLAVAHREKKRNLDVYADNRYFATNVPYEEAAPHIRRGVVKNLDLIHAYCRDRLKVPFAVALVGRAYQYSERECPLDYEAHLYTIRGPHVRNPSRFFEEAKDDLPYPVLDLLPVFEGSGRFPLYFEDDPHWNAAGARLAAQALFDFLSDARLLPDGPREAGGPAGAEVRD